MNESLLFGVRVRRVFVVLRLLHGGCNHEEQPGTVQQNDLQQRKDHQSDKNCSNHSVPPEKWAKENHRPGGWWLRLFDAGRELAKFFQNTVAVTSIHLTVYSSVPPIVK